MAKETKDTNESREDYLERILMLTEEGNSQIHAINIAASMGFSKASVSIALKKLEEQGYVLIDDKQVLTLSESGKAIAEKIYERHKIIGDLLVQLGVDKEIAYQDACKMEHDLSDESFAALKEAYLKRNQK